MCYYKFAATACKEEQLDIEKMSTREFIVDIYKDDFHCSLPDLLQGGIIRVMGWCFVYTDILNKYLVRFTDGCTGVYYAPDRTLLRKNLSRVRHIIEIPKDF